MPAPSNPNPSIVASTSAKPVNGSVWPRMLVPLPDDGDPAAAGVPVFEALAVLTRDGEAELAAELDFELAAVVAADVFAALASGVRGDGGFAAAAADIPAVLLPGVAAAVAAADPEAAGVLPLPVAVVVGVEPVGVGETTLPADGDRPPNWRTPFEPVALLPPPTWTVPRELVALLPEPLPICSGAARLPLPAGVLPNVPCSFSLTGAT
jgi:hypothetical protein